MTYILLYSFNYSSNLRFLFLQICRSEEECRRNLDDFLSRKNRLEHAIESWRTTETNLRQQIAKTLEGSIQKFSADSEHSVSVSVRDAKNDVLSVHGPSVYFKVI